jgi:hypothetical protein
MRRFDLRSQTRIVGTAAIPIQQLAHANGDLVYSAEINETLYPDAPPDQVPLDVWQSTVELVNSERQAAEKPGLDPQATPRPTLQVVELVRIPYTIISYRYADQDYTLYIYDKEGQEKFYAERSPARWDRVERLVKAISSDLTTPIANEVKRTGGNTSNPLNNSNNYSGGYRVPVEVPPYTIIEEDEEEDTPPSKPE